MKTKEHVLKCWNKFFVMVLKGLKTFELRLNDRDFQVGDMVTLREYNNKTKRYSGREITFEISYMLHLSDWFGADNKFVIMGFKSFEYQPVFKARRKKAASRG